MYLVNSCKILVISRSFDIGNYSKLDPSINKTLRFQKGLRELTPKRVD